MTAMFYFVWMFDAYGESALASSLSAESSSAPLLLGFLSLTWIWEIRTILRGLDMHWVRRPRTESIDIGLVCKCWRIDLTPDFYGCNQLWDTGNSLIFEEARTELWFLSVEFETLVYVEGRMPVVLIGSILFWWICWTFVGFLWFGVMAVVCMQSLANCVVGFLEEVLVWRILPSRDC